MISMFNPTSVQSLGYHDQFKNNQANIKPEFLD